MTYTKERELELIIEKINSFEMQMFSLKRADIIELHDSAKYYNKLNRSLFSGNDVEIVRSFHVYNLKKEEIQISLSSSKMRTVNEFFVYLYCNAQYFSYEQFKNIKSNLDNIIKLK
jgi:hypothetical protein